MTILPGVAPNTPEVLEEFTLVTAVTRLDFLARRDNHVVAVGHDATEDDDWAVLRDGGPTSLDVDEALELLALGEVVARKAHATREQGVLAALRGGADWAAIAAALDLTPAAAWDQHTAWIDDQDAARGRGEEALDAAATAQARELSGARPG